MAARDQKQYSLYLTSGEKAMLDALRVAEGDMPDLNKMVRRLIERAYDAHVGIADASPFENLVKQNAVNILAIFKEKMREDSHKGIDKHLDELIKVKTR